MSVLRNSMQLEKPIGACFLTPDGRIIRCQIVAVLYEPGRRPCFKIAYNGADVDPHDDHICTEAMSADNLTIEGE